MCVIIHKPKASKLDPKYIEEGSAHNRSGFGIMWYDPEEKKIKALKSAKYDVKDVVKMMESLQDKEVVIHFRIATTGSVRNENCHPFKVLSKKQSGVDMFFMHNGCISTYDFPPEGDETDTNAFNKAYLIPVLRHKPFLIQEPQFVMGIKHIIGAGSKLCFMFGEGEVVIVNEKAGVERDGCWFSNSSAFPIQSTTMGTGRGGSNHWRGTHSHSPVDSGVKSEKKQTKRELLGAEVGVGDKVYVMDQKNNDYVGEGTIEAFMSTTVMVEFMDHEHNLKKTAFFLKDGTTTFGGNQYFVFPEKYQKDPSEEKKPFERQTVNEVLIADYEVEEEVEESVEVSREANSNVCDLSVARQVQEAIAADDAAEAKKNETKLVTKLFQHNSLHIKDKK